MNAPVPTANESAVGAASREKPLAPNTPPTDLYAIGFRLYHRRVTFLARRMPKAFAVYTPEGMQRGAAGDIWASWDADRQESSAESRVAPTL
jgi:hypothetical protein